MASGPLRQLMAVLGLVALTPTMALVALRRLPPGEAAVRAAATLLVVLAVGRIVALSMGYYARLVERGGPTAAGHERRRDDHA